MFFLLPKALFRPAVRCCVRCGDCRAGAEPEPGDRREAPVLRVCPDLAAWNQPDELPENGEEGLKFFSLLGARACRWRKPKTCTYVLVRAQFSSTERQSV